MRFHNRSRPGRHSDKTLHLVARDDFASNEIGCWTPNGVCRPPAGAVLLPGHYMVVVLEAVSAGQFGRFKPVPGGADRRADAD